MITKGTYLKIKPEWQDAGDEKFTWLAVENEDGGRVLVSRLGTGMSITPTSVMTTDMVEAA